MNPQDKIRAQAQKAELARLEGLVEYRYVRCADENDDRCLRDGTYLNPRFEEMNRKMKTVDWSPAICLDPKTNEEIYLPGVTVIEETRGLIGVFQAILSPELRSLNGTWYIGCWGGDDFSLIRRGMTEKKARKIWSLINNHITIRSLYKLGIKSE